MTSPASTAGLKAQRRRAARRAPAAVLPPTASAGPPGVAGGGVASTWRPRKLKGSPVKAPRSTATHSSTRWPRVLRSTPAISNSAVR